MSTDPTHALRLLAELQASDGWKFLVRVMEDEMVAAARQLATHRAMTMDEIHFRRGAIWAAEQLVNLPGRLVPIFETEAAIQAASAASAAQKDTDA